MTKKISGTIASVLLVLLLITGTGYYWFNSSVYTAYANFSKAVKDKNLDKTKKYLDLDKFVDSYYAQISESFGSATGGKEGAKTAIEEAIKEGSFLKNEDLVDNSIEAFNSKKLIVDGKDYKIKSKLGGESPLNSEIYFTKENNDWKITKIKIDFSEFKEKMKELNQLSKETIKLDSDNFKFKIQEVKIGEEIRTKKFGVKVTKLEFLTVLETKKEYGNEIVTLKPQNSNNIFAKFTYEAVNISNSGTYFTTEPVIETLNGQTYKKDYRENLYLFQDVGKGKNKLDYYHGD